MAEMSDDGWSFVSLLGAAAEEADDPRRRRAPLYGSHAIRRAARLAGGAVEVSGAGAAAAVEDAPVAGRRP